MVPAPSPPADPIAQRILVLGVGNTLMRDDGVGVRLLEALAAIEPAWPGIEYVDAGTLSFMLLPRIEGCDALLVLDAAHLDTRAGDIRTLEGTVMDEFLRSARCSVHEVGMRDLLDVARLTGHLPDRRAFVGVQPLDTGWGDSLSDPVAAALQDAVSDARAILARWREPTGDPRDESDPSETT
jgi:hydrogenase maturation protease